MRLMRWLGLQHRSNLLSGSSVVFFGLVVNACSSSASTFTSSSSLESTRTSSISSRSLPAVTSAEPTSFTITSSSSLETSTPPSSSSSRSAETTSSLVSTAPSSTTVSVSPSTTRRPADGSEPEPVPTHLTTSIVSTEFSSVISASAPTTSIVSTPTTSVSSAKPTTTRRPAGGPEPVPTPTISSTNLPTSAVPSTQRTTTVRLTSMPTSLAPLPSSVASSSPVKTTSRGGANPAPIIPSDTVSIMPTSSSAVAPKPSSSSRSTHSTAPAPAPSTKTSAKPVSSSPPAPSTSPSPKPTPTPTHSSASLPASTTTAATVVRASNTAPSVVALTTHASVTLSTPVALTTTNGNGAKVITTPPLVTIMSTSTEANGAVTTVTQIVANPPNSIGATSENTGFLHNQGAVAGIFVVVGLAVSGLLLGLFFFIRHRRRHNARKRWLAGMHQQRQSAYSGGDPFQDPRDGAYAAQPMMRTVEHGNDQDDIRYGFRDPSPLVDVPLTHDQRSFGHGASILPDPHPMMTPTESEDYSHQVPVGYAYTTDIPKGQGRRHSYAPSSPSIYPASLPPDEEIQHHERADTVANLKLQVPVSNVPPRPPRSHLRQNSKGLIEFTPMTPPTSISSGFSKPPSPIAETRPQDLFTRRTLLDVRTRPISPK